MGKILRGSSKNAKFIIADTTDIVQEALDIHKCTPMAIKAFGRLLTGAVMMGATLKGKDLLTLRTDTDGELSQMLVTADGAGNVKGYLNNPGALGEGKNKVGEVVGKGTLRVIKDMGLKDPYIGLSELLSGEIGDDIAYYYYTSEQTPSVVVVGVAINENMKVTNAGGYIIQLLPGATEGFIEKLEKKVEAMRSMTELMAGGMDLKKIAHLIYDDMEAEEELTLVEDYNLYGETKARYKCDCNKDKFLKGLATISPEEIKEILEETPTLEVECHFCGTKYGFTEEDLLG